MRKKVDPNPDSDVPPPGSNDAWADGCCARGDNAYGRGYHHDRYGRPLFLVSEECPLHATARTELSV